MVESFFTGLLAKTVNSEVSTELYQQMTDSLLYFSLRTRLDILTPVLISAGFQKSLMEYCHCGVKRVIHYLRGTN